MGYPTADIRRLLIEAFSDEELEVFCFDHFPEVANDFGAGMSKGEKVQRLIEYCQRRELFPALLTALQTTRPEQYQHLSALPHADLSQPQSTTSVPTSASHQRSLLIAVISLAGLLLVALADRSCTRSPVGCTTVPLPTYFLRSIE